MHADIILDIFTFSSARTGGPRNIELLWSWSFSHLEIEFWKKFDFLFFNINLFILIDFEWPGYDKFVLEINTKYGVSLLKSKDW